MARIPTHHQRHLQYFHSFIHSFIHSSDPSCVLRMSNIITLEDLEDDLDYQALLEDLQEGCQDLGTVVSLHVPRIHVVIMIVVND